MLPPIYTWLKADSAVTAIIGSPPRAYRHQSAPQDTTRPYVTWNMVTGVPENTLSELPKIDRITVDIDCWHQTDAGVEALAVAVRDAIEPYAHMTGMPINLREPETKLYRIGLQFDVWLDRPSFNYLALAGDAEPGLLALAGDMTDGDDVLKV
jgi:hypothetical protein